MQKPLHGRVTRIRLARDSPGRTCLLACQCLSQSRMCMVASIEMGPAGIAAVFTGAATAQHGKSNNDALMARMLIRARTIDRWDSIQLGVVWETA